MCDHLDTTPVDVDKKAFNLRIRDKDKELAHSNFRIHDVSEVDRLNKLYEDDLKVLDCEIIDNKMRKKRISLP